jgi:hypothetical protein
MWAVSDLDSIQNERFALFKAGLSPVDWGYLTKWQRMDLLRRHQVEVKEQLKLIDSNKLDGLIAVITKQVLKI